MLESDSPLTPWSPMVGRSLAGAGTSWLGFYLESGVLISVSGWLACTAFSVARVWITIPVAAMLVAVAMVYFRLLGRLGWCCAEASRGAGGEEEEKEGEAGAD